MRIPLKWADGFTMRSLFCLLLAATVPALHGDVTIRYRTDQTSTMPIPGTAGQEPSSVVYMKANKASSSDNGLITTMDFAKAEITLIDTARKTWATIPAAEYGRRMAAVMPQMPRQSTPAITAKTTTEKTGRSESILGIRAEETAITMTIGMTMPAGAPPMPELGFRIVMHRWTPAEGEVLRTPALRQLAGMSLWEKYFMNPAEAMTKVMPGGMEAAFADLNNDQGVTLRVTTEMYIGQSAPMMTVTREVTEISTAALDDALFQIPPECSPARFEDMMNDAIKARTEAAKAPAPGPRPATGDVQAYVPDLIPLRQTKAVMPDEAKAGGIGGLVELLVTIDARGTVAKAEALSGAEPLRKPAIDAVKQWTWRPVLRNGAAVAAFTNATVFFGGDATPGAPAFSMADTLAALQRREQLKQALPRSPQQILADLEQDAGGGGANRRYYALDGMAQAALEAGANEKAAAYAKELIAGTPEHRREADAVFDAHLVLGRVALRSGDVAAASAQLIEAGRTTGSPIIETLGPNMTLARELLDKGERSAVLVFLGECRTFWKNGGEQLDAWTAALHNGGTPVFPVTSLR